MATFTAYMALGTAFAAGLLTELSGNGYSRAQTNVSYDPVAGTVSFTGATFPSATGTWQQGLYAAIYDAPAGGNLLFSFPSNNPPVASGANTSVLAGLFRLSPNLSASYTVLLAQTQIGVTAQTAPIAGASFPGGLPVLTGLAPVNFNGTAFATIGTTKALVDGAIVAVSAPVSSYFSLTLTGSGRTLALTGGTNNQVVVIEVSQDATGGRTITSYPGTTWPAATPPTLSTASNAVDVLRFTYNSAAGVWRGELVGKAFG